MACRVPLVIDSAWLPRILSTTKGPEEVLTSTTPRPRWICQSVVSTSDREMATVWSSRVDSAGRKTSRREVRTSRP